MIADHSARASKISPSGVSGELAVGIIRRGLAIRGAASGVTAACRGSEWCYRSPRPGSGSSSRRFTQRLGGDPLPNAVRTAEALPIVEATRDSPQRRVPEPSPGVLEHRHVSMPFARTDETFAPSQGAALEIAPDG